MPRSRDILAAQLTSLCFSSQVPSCSAGLRSSWCTPCALCARTATFPAASLASSRGWVTSTVPSTPSSIPSSTQSSESSSGIFYPNAARHIACLMFVRPINSEPGHDCKIGQCLHFVYSRMCIVMLLLLCFSFTRDN